jgi:uncharacterized protein
VRVGAALAGTIAVLVWLLSPELPWAARAWLAFLLAVLPALMIAQARQLAVLGDLPRRAAYYSSIASLWVLALLTFSASRLSGLGAADLGLTSTSAGSFLAWAAALTAAGVAVLFAFRFAGFREGPMVRELMPQDGADRLLFVGLSVTAGITEEFIFRGFLLYALVQATGSLPLAIFVGSAAFGVVHAYQHPVGALRAGLLGAILAAPLLLEGTLYPAIAAHALIDILSGLWLARYLLR